MSLNEGQENSLYELVCRRRSVRRYMGDHYGQKGDFIGKE